MVKTTSREANVHGVMQRAGENRQASTQHEYTWQRDRVVLRRMLFVVAAVAAVALLIAIAALISALTANDSTAKVQGDNNAAAEKISANMKEMNPCSSHPCLHNATCLTRFTDNKYICKCPAGYSGERCQQDIDECRLASFSCHAQGQCVSLPVSYTCRCLPGYVGDGKSSCDAPFVNATSSCANSSGSQSNTQGIIESNPISTTYTNDMDCQWNIYSNAALELAFHRFNTEPCCDYVRVYNGGSAFSPLIGRFSGSSLPAPITTLSNGLRVRFTSDNSRTYQGFDARYRAIARGSVRINGGSSTGRVEIYYDGQWGTVCDDAWDINDANVVCRQLGFQQALQAYSDATHGQGSGPIWIDDLACSGSESHLYDCQHNGWGSHNCRHSEDASVQCSRGTYVVRLVNSASYNYFGRVEVYHSGHWGTVCDDDWDMNDANVVCRQLGFSSASYAPGGATYGQGSYIIWLDEVNCQGSEASLLDCAHSGWGRISSCSHSEDAGVVCNT